MLLAPVAELFEPSEIDLVAVALAESPMAMADKPLAADVLPKAMLPLPAA
jgi:hypothetical protein